MGHLERFRKLWKPCWTLGLVRLGMSGCLEILIAFHSQCEKKTYKNVKFLWNWHPCLDFYRTSGKSAWPNYWKCTFHFSACLARRSDSLGTSACNIRHICQKCSYAARSRGCLSNCSIQSTDQNMTQLVIRGPTFCHDVGLAEGCRW